MLGVAGCSLSVPIWAVGFVPGSLGATDQTKSGSKTCAELVDVTSGKFRAPAAMSTVRFVSPQ